MSLDVLKEELKQNVFRPVYYITGKEPFLKSFYFNQLKNKALGDGDASVDLTEYVGQTVSADELAESLQAFAVTAEHKVVVVMDPVFSSDAVTYLVQNPDLLCDTAVLIFIDEAERSEAKTDKKFVAFIEKYGLSVSIDKPDRRTLEAWIAKRLRSAEKNISREALDYLIENVGDDMATLSGELGKLTAYCDGEISVKAIDEICIKTAEARTFDLSDAILVGDGAKAYGVLNVLIDLQTEPSMIAGAIFGAVCNLFKVKVLTEQGVSSYELGQKLNMKDFLVRKYATAAARKPMSRILEMVDQCTKADEDMKLSVGAVDPYMALIKLTAVLCK